MNSKKTFFSLRHNYKKQWAIRWKLSLMLTNVIVIILSIIDRCHRIIYKITRQFNYKEEHDVKQMSYTISFQLRINTK